MQESGIYKITNIKTGRMYIGSSVNITNRLSHHFSHLSKGTHHCSYLQNSYNKWGRDSFDFDILEYVDNLDTLLEREQFYIDSIGLGNLYNTNPIARSARGVKRSPETRAKIRVARLGKKISAESLEKWKLRRHPEEVLAKLKGRKHTKETRAKLSAMRTGTKRSEETKAKMSIAGKRRITSEETREKQRLSWIARSARGVSEETKRKLSISARKQDSQCKAVQQLSSDTKEVVAIFFSAGDAHRQTGINQSSISHACHGKIKSAGGYCWKFA